MIILGSRNNGAPFPPGCALINKGTNGVFLSSVDYPIAADNTLVLFIQFNSTKTNGEIVVRDGSLTIKIRIAQQPDVSTGRVSWLYGNGSTRAVDYAAANFDNSIKMIAIRHTASSGLVEFFIGGTLMDSFTAATTAISGGKIDLQPDASGVPTKYCGLFVYSDLLTDTELSEILTYGASKLPSDNMFLGWPMCEQTESKLYDVSGNGSDVSWTGTPAYSTQADIFYARQKGYSKYTKSGADDLYVPYGIDGSALTITPPSGYTKAFDAPA